MTTENMALVHTNYTAQCNSDSIRLHERPHSMPTYAHSMPTPGSVYLRCLRNNVSASVSERAAICGSSFASFDSCRKGVVARQTDALNKNRWCTRGATRKPTAKTHGTKPATGFAKPPTPYTPFKTARHNPQRKTTRASQTQQRTTQPRSVCRLAHISWIRFP